MRKLKIKVRNKKMKIENNKIIEATESELYSHWLKSGYEKFIRSMNIL